MRYIFVIEMTHEAWVKEGNMNALSKQFKEIVKGSEEKLKGIQNKAVKVAERAQAEGRKVAEKVKATVAETRNKGSKVVGDLLSDQTLKDILEKFGGLRVSEIMERLKASELVGHTEALRNELLSFLRIASIEQVENLRIQNEKLAKEVASLRALKQQLAKVAAEVKALKGTSKR